MPNLDWQLTIVVLSLAGAAAFLVRRGILLWRTGSRVASEKCGGCGSCSSGQNGHPDAPGDFVALEMLKSPDSRS